MSGRKTSSEMAVGLYSRASASASAPVMRDQHLESLVARQIAEHAGIVRIVFDDQQHRVAFHEIVAIVFDARFLLGRRNVGEEDRRGRHGRAGLFPS